MTSPPEAAMPLSRPRRLTLAMANRVWLPSSVMSRPLGGGADGRVDTLITAAAAEIAGHRLRDLGIGGRRLARQQRRGLHDLAGLAVAALRHAGVAPGDL